MSRRHRCARIAAALMLFFLRADAILAAQIRSFDGSGNNLTHADWGAANTDFARIAPAAYDNGISSPRMAGLANPRSVGVALMRQTQSHPDDRCLSGYVYAFGNLLSHDIQATQSATTEFVSFRIPTNDDIFAPNQLVQLPRSLFDPATGTAPGNPRQQVNFTTSFIDGSQVYGSDAFTASVLRGGPAHPGAKLRTSDDINGDGENLLPRNAFGPSPATDFVAGDGRVNDNIALTAMQTLFMREHNRLVDELAPANPTWTAEDLYQHARKLVGAELQSITYHEFLPVLMGSYAPSTTGHYDPEVNPSAVNEVAAVFLRVGHSMLTANFLRIENDGSPAPEGPLPVEQGIEDPSQLTTSHALDLFLKGLSVERQEETDLGLVDAMRIALLDAFDIQRARDHGLPDYNTMRAAYGLPQVQSFAEISSDPVVQQALASVYANVNSIDPLVGALAEDHLPGASIGPLVAAAYRLQFDRLRDGDRFWYQNDPDLTAAEVATINATRLSDIIRRNSGITNLQANVFFVPEPVLRGGQARLAVTIACGLASFFGRRRSRRLKAPALRSWAHSWSHPRACRSSGQSP